MKTTKKPMMAKRTTKAAPAKKKMMASTKKPMTVAGKKVGKYQVGGTVSNPGGPSAMPPSNPRVIRPGTAGNMPTKVAPKTGGVSPRPAPAKVGYGGRMRNMQVPGQGMVANNGGAMMGQSPDYAQASQLLARMDPRSPFYNAIQQRVQQMGGLQANNGGPMMNPQGSSPAQIAQNNLARQQLMQQGMSMQEIRAQEDAIRQQLMQRGIQPGQGIGMPIGNRGQIGAGRPLPSQPNFPPMMQGMQGLGSPGMGMAKPSPGAVQGGSMPQKPPLAQSGFLNTMYPGFQPDPNYQYNPQTSGRSDPNAIAARLAEENARLAAQYKMDVANGMAPPPKFGKGGAVKKKKAPASGRMAKPKGRMSTRGKR